MNFVILFLFLVACSSKPIEQKNEPAIIAPLAPEILTPAPEPIVKAKFENENDLKNELSAWLQKNNSASYEEAVKQANHLLNIYGYPFVLDVSHTMLKKNLSRLELKAGKKIFVFESGKELSANLDICGERYLRIPAKIISPTKAALINDNKEYPFSLDKYRRERFRIFKGKKKITTIYSPEPAEPIGISLNGKAIFIKFPLDEVLTTKWWLNLTQEITQLADEDPYLVVKVETKKISFEPDASKLIPQQFEVLDSSSNSLRWKFQPSEHILELSSLCER